MLPTRCVKFVQSDSRQNTGQLLQENATNDGGESQVPVLQVNCIHVNWGLSSKCIQPLLEVIVIKLQSILI